MKITLCQRIPDPSVAYAFKEVVVEGDEKEKLIEELLKKTSEWKKQTQILVNLKTTDMSSGEEEKKNVLKSLPVNQG